MVGVLDYEAGFSEVLASCHGSRAWMFSKVMAGPVDAQVAKQSHGLVRRGSASSLEGAGAEAEAAPLSEHSGRQAALVRRRQRWRSFVGLGLIVATFLPASNLFFWVSARD